MTATAIQPRVRFIPANGNLALVPFSTEYIKRRVAAYARVSTDEEEQLNSYEAQVNYYTKHIQENDEWKFAGMYADKDRSGTTTKGRDDFNRMIADALAGKIDLIITKSVSRFARNTVDTLTTVRQLKEKGVEVYFEKENIYTLDSKGELLITIMSSLAQEESRSISENVTRGQRWRMAEGKVSLPYKQFLGYEKGADGLPQIVEAEATIVRRIYRLFLYGKAPATIANTLTKDDIPTPSGRQGWRAQTVISILTNEKYKGDALLQKSYTVDFLTKKTKINEGEVPQYYVEGSHPAIIEPSIFDLVQQEMKERKASGKASAAHPFSSRIFCGDCGGGYGSKVWHSNDKYRRTVWSCNGKHYGGKSCQTPHLTCEEIQTAFIAAYNGLINHKAEIIQAYGEICGILTDTAAIDAERRELQQECDVVTELLRKCIEENAHTALNQDEYRQQYEGYAARFETARNKLAELDAERLERIAKRTNITRFLETLEQRDGHISEFDEELWYITVDNVKVYDGKRMIFTFKNGTTAEIPAVK